MKEVNLGEIHVSEINGKFVFTIDARWKKFFSTENLSFCAKIDCNGRYTIVGPVIKTGSTANQHFAKGVSNNE